MKAKDPRFRVEQFWNGVRDDAARQKRQEDQQLEHKTYVVVGSILGPIFKGIKWGLIGLGVFLIVGTAWINNQNEHKAEAFSKPTRSAYELARAAAQPVGKGKR